MNSRLSRFFYVATIVVVSAGAVVVGFAGFGYVAASESDPRWNSSSPRTPCTEGAGIFSRLPGGDSSGVPVNPSDPISWRVLKLSGSGADGRFIVEIARSPLWIEVMGAEVRARIFVDLTDAGVEIPLRVERVSEPPSLVPGEDPLVTGIIDYVFEDSAGVDTVCYLEAHDFGGPVPEPDSVWVLLGQFRRKGRISRNKGTVSYMVLAGRAFYGVNASLDDDLSFVDEDREGAMREFWHQRLAPEFDFGMRGSRYLAHAEGHVLMRAYRQLGYLPPEVTLFVDRETCQWCGWGLTGLMEAVGVRRLTVVQKGEEEPLVLEVGSSVPDR